MAIGAQETYGNMRLLKLVIISVVFLFCIVTFIGLLFPSTIIVSRAVDVNASADSIYVYTKDLSSWKYWVASLQNQNIENNFETKLGLSTIKITASSKEKVTGEWIEKNGDKQLMALSTISANNDKSVVQWQFEQHIKWYPWARFGSMINDKIIGGMMEQNLANLKRIVEKAK